jgi:competence protein ComEA
MAVIGMLLVVALAAAGFGIRVAWARAASAPTVVSPGVPGGQTGAPSALAASRTVPVGFGSDTTAAGGGGPPTGAAGVVTVHVVGQVKRPGVVELAAGSRVSDAVERAGGASSGADLGGVNLARVVLDGEQIRVPKQGESLPTQDAAGATPGTPGGGGGSVSGGLLNLNTASVAQLEDLPGVGPVLAQRIIDWRTEHGRFTSVDELAEVSGIGEKMFAQLQPKVTV